MPKAFSLYLDFIRWAAAISVFLNHLGFAEISGQTIWWRFTEYGTVAVTIFFVLSGYVIAYTTETREKTATAYVVNRVSRLYSVILPALLATLALDSIGAHIAPTVYEGSRFLIKDSGLPGYLSALLMVNEFQVLQLGGVRPGTNNPFWSLSFEFAYYAVAGVLIFVRSRPLAWGFGLVVLVLGGLTITVLLPVWAMGFALYRWRDRVILPSHIALGLALVTAALLFQMPTLKGMLPNIDAIQFPWGRGPYQRHVIFDYVVALTFAVHLVAVRAVLADRWSPGPRVTKLVRFMGATTFPLYCMHYPLMCFLFVLSPWAIDDPRHALYIFGVTMVAVALITPACEKLKFVLRDKLSQMFKQRAAQ